jgi:hypothetical protein
MDRRQPQPQEGEAERERRRSQEEDAVEERVIRESSEAEERKRKQLHGLDRGIGEFGKGKTKVGDDLVGPATRIARASRRLREARPPGESNRFPKWIYMYTHIYILILPLFKTNLFNFFQLRMHYYKRVSCEITNSGSHL